MKSALKLSAASMFVVLIALPVIAAASLTTVVQTPNDEDGIVVGSGGMAWEKSSRKLGYWVVADTGLGPWAVNSLTSSWAWTGSMEGNVLTYQLVTRRGSDIARIDIAVPMMLPRPANVNSRRWEYAPKASGQWVLFGRTNIDSDPKRVWRRLLLVNTVTGESRQLSKGGAGASFLPGQVSGDWVVWEECPKYVCDVYRYQISTATKVKIPKIGADQYSPAISSDGTMYFLRSGNACGSDATIIRRALNDTESPLYTFPTGIEAQDLYVYDGPQDDLYLASADCQDKSFQGDIYKLSSADTASPTMSRSQGSTADPGVMPRRFGVSVQAGSAGHDAVP